MVSLMNILPLLDGWRRDYNDQPGIVLQPGDVHRVPSPSAWAHKGWLRWLKVRVDQRYTNIRHNFYAEKPHVFNYYTAFLDGIWMAPPDGQLYLTAYNTLTDRYVAMMNPQPPLEFDKGAIVEIIAPKINPVTGAAITTAVNAVVGWYAVLITDEDAFERSLNALLGERETLEEYFAETVARKGEKPILAPRPFKEMARKMEIARP